jgi:hypothetical protein
VVETVEFRQVIWFVMLESSKDRVLGVNTIGQQVPPHVLYEIACLLIRDVVGSVPCSDEWKIGVVTRPGSHGARGSRGTATTAINLSNAMVLHSTLAKLGIQHIVNICNDM